MIGAAGKRRTIWNRDDPAGAEDLRKAQAAGCSRPGTAHRPQAQQAGDDQYWGQHTPGRLLFWEDAANTGTKGCFAVWKEPDEGA